MARSFPGASYDAWKTTEPDVEGRTCIYCGSPAVVESAVGRQWHADDKDEPRPEWRCEECQASFERVAKREQRLAQEGWI